MSENKKAELVVVENKDSWLQPFFAGMRQTAQMIDGWKNAITGINVAGKDARMSMKIFWRKPIEVDLEHLYAGDAMAAKIVDKVVDTAFEKGYSFTGISKDEEKKLKDKCKELCFDETIMAAKKKARLYGGSVILKVYDDNLVLEQAVDPEKPAPIKSFVIFQRFELYSTWEMVNKNILSQHFNTPMWYSFVGRSAAAAYVTNIQIHASRLVRSEGAWLPDRLRQSNNYWNDSVLSKLYDAIRNYADAHESVNAAIKDLSVAVLKIKDLDSKVSSTDGEALLRKRLEAVNLTKSIIRAVVIDADGEEFEYKVRQLGGAEKLLEKAEDRLSSESNIPRTILFGEQSAGGLGSGASGEHSSDNWHSFVETYQKNDLKPSMLNILKDFCVELGIKSDSLDIEFEPLWQESQKEIVEGRNKQADTDQKYIDMGVLDAQEVRDSRFGGDEYSIETHLDMTISAEDLEPEQPTEQQLAAVPIDKTRIKPPATKNDKWVILSDSKTKVLARLDSEEKALRRLRQFEYFKNKKP